MRVESKIDNENAKVSVKLWKQHFIKQEQNTTGIFNVSEEKYIYIQNPKGKRIHEKNKKGCLRLKKQKDLSWINMEGQHSNLYISKGCEHQVVRRITEDEMKGT